MALGNDSLIAQQVDEASNKAAQHRVCVLSASNLLPIVCVVCCLLPIVCVVVSLTLLSRILWHVCSVAHSQFCCGNVAMLCCLLRLSSSELLLLSLFLLLCACRVHCSICVSRHIRVAASDCTVSPTIHDDARLKHTAQASFKHSGQASNLYIHSQNGSGASPACGVRASVGADGPD